MFGHLFASAVSTNVTDSIIDRISNFGLNITATSQVPLISYGADSLGYTLSVVYLVILVSLYGIYWVTRLIRCNNLKDNKVYLPDLQMTQRGFVDSRFGVILQVMTFLFVLWLHVAMLMAIIGHYQNQWPFDLSLDKGSVDWDSFTRVFMSTWVGSIIVAFLGRVFRNRMKSFYLRPCSLSVAKYIKLSQVLTDDLNSEKSLRVLHEEVVKVETKPTRHVDYLLNKLSWSDSEGIFSTARRLNPADIELIKSQGGLSHEASLAKLNGYGRNEIRISVPSFTSMVREELSTSFFMYQIYGGVLLSLYWDYITAGILCLLLILTSASIKVYLERKERLLLSEATATTLRGSVWVRRDGHWTRVTSEELVMGDLICVSDDSFDVCKEITADCILVGGSAVVDESSLTGETMPVQKNCFSAMSFDDPDHAKSCLFAGTWLLQSSDASETERPGSVANGALAVVIGTGGSTTRGEVIRSLMFGRGTAPALEGEFKVVICILIIIAGINFWVVDVAHELTMASILPAVSSLVGVISPLLTVALVGGEVRAAKRLRTSCSIHVKEVNRLTHAGMTDMVLLDKTGTITKSGLEFTGVVPASSLRLSEGPVSVELGACLALAHSVTRVNGTLVGHQVELQMVEAALKNGWKFGADMRAPTDAAGNVWEIEKLFPFSHSSMTMSALVVQRSSNQRVIVCKGSFEALQQGICTDISEEISRACSMYAQDGYYVLGTCMRLVEATETFNVGTLERNELEKGLGFQGFLLFKNEIKPDSGPVIEELKKAGIMVVIVSGDSVFTSTAVARSVGVLPVNSKIVIGVIDPKTKLIEWRLADTDSRISEESLQSSDSNACLCITGEVFDLLKSEGKLELGRTFVFGRMSPAQKAEVVQLYSDTGRHVLMVGDGANDSIALRTAHSGLALRTITEANVAAPFTTVGESLRCLVTLIQEARCAMTTSLAAYRYLISVGLIQTITKTLLYLQCSGFVSGVASLFTDCILIPVMLFCICSALPEKSLANTAPEGSLLGPEMVLSVIWTVVIGILCIGIAEGVLINADFFVPFVSEAAISSWRQRTDSFESALVVILRLFLFTDIAFVYSYGSVHRRALLTNWRLWLSGLIFLGLVTYLLFGPVGIPQAAFIVHVNEQAALEAGSTVFNQFLFYYERIGGVWYGVTDSIEFSKNYRIALVAILVLLSIVHHIGFRLAVIGPVTRWFHQRLGWRGGSCACCRRRRPKGYKPLSIQMSKVDALDESINQASELDSPAAEWELRRTYGRWRAPTEPEYK